MNNVTCPAEDESPRSLLITSVNIHMALVVLTFLCNVSALIILFRRSLRRKLLTCFLINLNVTSLVQSGLSHAFSIGKNFKTQNSSGSLSLCKWVAFAELLSKLSYSSTLCVINVVSKRSFARCCLGANQRITKNSKVIFFAASWLCSIGLSSSILFEESLSAHSSSKLTCQLNWPSHESHVLVFNVIIVLMGLTLPVFVCSTMQYLCFRVWRNSRTLDRARQRAIAYRRKSNHMVIALTYCFYGSQLPLSIANIIVMTTGCYSYSLKAGFILELLAKSSTCQAPFVYVFLYASYRAALKQMLSGSSEQTNTRPGANAARINQRGGVEAARNRTPGRRQQAFQNRVGQSPQVAAAGTTTDELNPYGSSGTT